MRGGSAASARAAARPATPVRNARRETSAALAICFSFGRFSFPGPQRWSIYRTSAIELPDRITRRDERHHMRTVSIAVGAFLLGVATVALHGDAAQPVAARRAIHPEKGPNTGLPFSPGILAGNTLYIS